MTGTTLRLSPRTLDAILTPPRINSFDWICEHACNKRGMPFDYLSYPWTKGICEEWDNPRRERIFFQAGSRLGKTELGMSLLECGMATAPDIAMMGGPTGDKVEQWIKDRLTPMIENCLPLRDWLPPPHRRPKDTLHLRHGTIYGAWSGSPTTLGDLDPRYLLGFEIDKFTKASSEEADSLMLLLERGAEIPNRRVYCESTPTIFGKSRIDKKVR
jgi:phage terminase large subunit GpA-like protein